MLKNDRSVSGDFGKRAGFVASCINNNKQMIKVLLNRFLDIIQQGDIYMGYWVLLEDCKFNRLATVRLLV